EINGLWYSVLPMELAVALPCLDKDKNAGPGVITDLRIPQGPRWTFFLVLFRGPLCPGFVFPNQVETDGRSDDIFFAHQLDMISFTRQEQVGQIQHAVLVMHREHGIDIHRSPPADSWSPNSS